MRYQIKITKTGIDSGSPFAECAIYHGDTDLDAPGPTVQAPVFKHIYDANGNPVDFVRDADGHAVQDTDAGGKPLTQPSAPFPHRPLHGFTDAHPDGTPNRTGHALVMHERFAPGIDDAGTRGMTPPQRAKVVRQRIRQRAIDRARDVVHLDYEHMSHAVDDLDEPEIVVVGEDA